MAATSRSDATRVVTLASRSGTYGGPFDTATNQARLLAAHGHDIALVAGYRRDDKPDPESSSAFPVFLERVYGPWRLIGPVGMFSPRVAWRMFRTIRTSRVVHVSFARELIPVFATLCSLALRRRIVLQPHGMLTVGRGRARVIDPLMRGLMRRSDHVIALTQRESDEIRTWLGHEQPPIVIIGNPVLGNADHRRSLPQRPVGASHDVLFLARLAPRKNVGHFVRAAELATASGHAERYSVVGPDGGDLERVLQAADTTTLLAYEGTLPGDLVSKRIASASVFVLTSENEPWGNGLVTAVANGVPVVVPESAALAADLTRHGAGLAYPDGDVAALTLRIRELVDDPARYSSAVDGCASFTRTILAPSAGEQTLVTLYERLLS